RLARVELDPVQLGDAVDDRRDLDAEVVLDLLEGGAGVLDGVVQQRGGDGHVVEAEVGDDAGDGHRVLDVGLARVARLPPVGLGGPQVGTGDQVGRRLRVAAAVGGQHRQI